MKTVYLLLAWLFLCFSPSPASAQTYYYQRFDGADTSPISSLIIWKDTSRPVNSWQIGKPYKTVFRDAYTPPRAIVTDTANPYPKDDTSTFGFTKSTPYSNYVLAVRWMQKLDYDSSHQDGGYVEYRKNADPWMNIFSSLEVHNVYGFLQKNIDTLSNGQIAFTGTDSTWRDIWLCFKPRFITPADTLHVRFTSVSNGDSLQGDGWIIDNFLLRPTFVHTVSKIPTGHNAGIFPQPTQGDLIVEADNSVTEHYLLSVKLMDYQGKILEQYQQHLKRMQLDLSSYPNGIYLLQVETDQGLETHRVVLKR